MDTAAAKALRLARRLRALREEGWPDRPLKQAQVARALGVSVPSISSWESVKAPKMPPLDRLNAYARLFASPRSLDTGKVRLLGDDELTDAERARRDELQHELTLLHQGAPLAVRQPASGGLWSFDGTDVTIVCAPVPSELRRRMPYADPRDPDYIESYAYADLDALLELYGHVRAVNPASQVNLRLASALSRDDLTAHLVVLGGVDWNELTRDVLQVVDVPVTQLSSEIAGGAAFEAIEGGKRRTFRAILKNDGDAKILVEDIAHFFRGPNPFNRKRTVTICNGLFGRGTYAAVRTLTDSRFRERNADYVSERFAGSDTFSILARVRIVRGRAVTPDWTLPDTRLHAWPEPRT